MTTFVDGNHIQLLRNGTEYFPALVVAIDLANHDIYLQTYIYQADAIGELIGNALMRAAKRGVAVHVLIDGFGSKDLPPYFVKTLTHAGVHVRVYRPKISPWTLKKSRLRRLHQKIVVIDSTIGFVGGINIIDDYDIPEPAPNNVPPRIDYAVRIEGKLMPAITDNVRKLWHRITWTPLRTAKALHQKNKSKKAKVNTAPATPMSAALVIRDNVLHRRDIEEAYLSAIQNARSEIIIANAYFVPGWRFRRALMAAANRGVRVTLLLQGRMEYFLMFATHAFYHEFLKSGIEIFEYHKSFMHSKVAVIDAQWATVGSSNIDPFSLFLAREANVVINDTTFAAELRSDICHTIESGASQILPHVWARANLLKRASSWLAFGMVRLFLDLIGRRNEE